MSSNFGYQHIMQMQNESPVQNNPKQPYDVLQQQPEPEILGQQPLKQENRLAEDQHRYKSFKQILMMILNISLSSFYFGYIISYISAVDFNTIMSVYHIDIKKQLAQGLLIGCIPIGGGIGALSSSILMKRFSRRHSLMIVNGIALVTGICLFFPHMETLLLARTVQGMCAGFYSSLAPLIMKQLSPRQISGTLTSCNQILIAFGVFFSFSFSELLSMIYNHQTSKETWWIVFGFSLLILVVQTFMLHYVYPYQTPKYLYLQNRDIQGRELISVIFKPEYVEVVVKQMKQSIGRVETQIEEQLSADNKSQIRSHNSSLDTPRLAVIVAIHLAVLQQFSGINAVMAYGGQIVGESAPSMKLILPILINLEQVIASVFASYLLTKIGRKTLFQYGCIGAGVSCSLTALGFLVKNPDLSLGLIILGLVLFMANFGLTLGPVVWVYLPEIVQPRILPYATGVNWGTAALIMLLFPMIKQSLPHKNPALLFIFFATYCFASILFNKKYLIETKNKTQKQIFAEYGRQAAFC